MLTKSLNLSLLFIVCSLNIQLAVAEIQTDTTATPIRKNSAYEYKVIEVTPAKVTHPEVTHSEATHSDVTHSDVTHSDITLSDVTPSKSESATNFPDEVRGTTGDKVRKVENATSTSSISASSTSTNSTNEPVNNSTIAPDIEKNHTEIIARDKSHDDNIPGDSSHIMRSQFTTAIVNREPTDDVVMLTNNSSKIYYFNELSDLNGHNVTHQWKYQGKTMAEIKFDVKSDQWRVYSSKKIRPDWTGEWSVVLIDENGSPITADKFQVVEASDQ